MEEKKEKQENDIGAYASLFHIIDAKEQVYGWNITQNWARNCEAPINKSC